MRNTVFLNDREYSKEILLVELSNLFWLQRQCLLKGISPSEYTNALITLAKENMPDAKE